ncbi:MAG: DNA adenine methylase [Candidatus Cryptobacteroides sp.]|nr:DNA adenine methylase [Candidatus Cryptobacteroides sp.]
MTQARPFIKWVGGKTQLLDEVRKALPRDFASRQHVTYVEPFVGGGAVMFWILQAYPNIERAVINDINPELICTYRVIQEKVEELIVELANIHDEYIPLGAEDRKAYFLEKRTRFNTKRTAQVETAALFIFLNRTCFNGLYRVNSKGEFNVPHGKYANPRICDADNLRACSKVLQKVEILCGDFAETERYAGPDTLFYFDPPYKPITETSSFTSYAKEGFDDAEQIRLRDFCDQISTNKALFVASNSDPKNVNPSENFFDNLYNHFIIKRVSAARMINSDASGRGAISELMISNVVNA